MCLPFHQKKWHVFCLLSVTIFVIGVITRLKTTNDRHLVMITESEKKGSSYNYGINVDNNKIILLWNSFYGSRNYGVGAFGRKGFIRHHCKVDTCSLETDKRLLNKSAAVVFHMRNKIESFPKHADSRQVFVYFLRESPHHTFGNSPRYRKHFNITMTYRRDSDIPVPITRYIRLTNASGTKYKLTYPLSSKVSDVAWLVSHCGTPSKREKYAAALAKYINVDVYGACGRYNCPRNVTCMKRLERKYKFYLSFENSFCKDYVTEKY